jgi:hypothetical protein
MMEVWKLKDDGDPITAAHNEIRHLRGEIERLNGERAGDQHRLFLYEAEIERLTWILNRINRIEPETRARAEAEWLRAEAKRLRK